MSRKAFITIIATLFVAVSSCFAQQDSSARKSEYIDGLIRIKLVDSYPLNFTVNSNRTINIEEIDFLKKCEKKYHITAFRQDFNLKNDPKLLRILTIKFENTELTDKLIRKLEKNKKIEYVERVGLKNIMPKRTATPVIKKTNE